MRDEIMVQEKGCELNQEKYKTSWPVGFSSRHVKGAFGRRLCGYAIALEAWRRGLSVTVDSTRADAFQHYTISSAKKSLRFNRSRVELTTGRALNITKDKEATRAYLRGAGIPTPVGIKISREKGLHKALEYADSIGYPVVLKRVVGSQGKGVFSGIKDEEELSYYYNHLLEKFSEPEFIVEKHFDGEDYRIYASRSEMLAAVKRVPANVMGDGEKTIRELIKAKNFDRKKTPSFLRG